MHQLYMAKLGVQLSDQQVTQRPTRTQRVAQKQAVQRNVLAQKRFEGLKEKAKEIQDTKFKDKIVDEVYYDERPKSFSVNQWGSMAGHLREWHLAKAKKRGEAIISIQKTRKKTIPFTLEGGTNSYKSVYETLSPDVKQFFDTPTEVLESKATRITTTKKAIQDKHTYAITQNAEAQAKLKTQESEYQAWWGRQSDKYRSDPRHRKSRFEKLGKIEDYMEEADAKWRGYQQGLDKGSAQLNQNKDISIAQIESYALDVANYERNREQAKNTNSTFTRNQAFERKQLESAGYEPLIIEKSFKGNPEGTSLSYYNPKTKDYKHIADYDVVGKIDVSKYERVAFSEPQQRTISYGGKNIGFSSRVGIFKDPTDTSKKLSTPYGKLDVTMDNLLSDARAKQYTDWQKDNAVAIKEYYSKPFVQPMEDTLIYDGSTGKTTKEITGGGAFIPTGDLPYGSGGQQTISTQPTGVQLTDDQLANVDPAGLWDATKLAGKTFGAGFKLAGKGLNVVDDYVHFDFKASPLGLQVISFGKKDKPTVVEQAFVDMREDIAIGSEKLNVWGKGGQPKIDVEEAVIKGEFDKKYQTAFEIGHMKNLIYEEETFEEASKEFEGSTEAEAIKKDYEKEYMDLHHDLSVDTSLKKRALAGGGMALLGMGSGVSKIIDSPAGAGLVVGAVAVLPPALKLIPTKVSLGLSGGLFGYGTYKFLSPTSTLEEAGSGLITAVISGGVLGYSGYKYLRTPVVKTVKIPKPVMDLKSHSSIGRDLKIITKEGKEINTVIFKNQKLSQYAQAGRRTIVTTKGRLLLDNFWKEIGVPAKFTTLDSHAMYRGIPTQQLGSKEYFESAGGLFKVGRQGGYQKAFKRLTEYGYTSPQATATLRYTAPKITEQYLDKGVLFVKGNKAYGEFTYLTKSPVITIDKKLGIKTKGASTIRTKYAVERRLFNTKVGVRDIELIVERKSFATDLLNKKGDIFSIKDMGIKTSASLSKSSKLYQGYEPTADTGIYKQVKIKNLINQEVTSVKPYDYLKTVGKPSHTVLIDDIIDFQKKANVWQKPANIKKTPFSKTFGYGKKEDIIFDIGKPSSDLLRVINKLDDVALRSGGGTNTQAMSKYYGTGTYEQSFGGLSPAQSQNLQAQLKTALAPPVIKIAKLDSILKLKPLSDVGLGVKLSSLIALKTATTQRSSLKLKSDLKVENLVKNAIKSASVVKTAQLPAQKTSPALKSQLKTILAIDTAISPSLVTPPRTPPTLKTPPFKQPNIPLVLWLDLERGKKKKKGIDQAFNEKAYLPDFTSRSLGLTQDVSEKKLMAKINKLQTGFEIRRGINIKKPKGIKIKW